MKKAGSLIVIPGTNEIAIITKKGSGRGLFSERLRSGALTEAAIVGKLPDKLAILYWNNKRRAGHDLSTL
jgi:hypothetical protein